MTDDDIIALPDDALPSIDELPGQWPQVARVMLDVLPDERLVVRLVLALGLAFRSTNIYAHSFDKFARRWRDKRIIGEYGSGGKVPDLARKYRLSERQVWTILGRPDDRQLGLF